MPPIGRPVSCSCGACKKCRHREYMRTWYAKLTPAEKRAAVKRRDPAKVRAQKKRTYARTGPAPPAPRAHLNANNAVYRAKKRGTLMPEPCLFCDDENVVAHHHDYTQHLEVTWLCRHHHGRIHRQAVV